MKDLEKRELKETIGGTNTGFRDMLIDILPEPTIPEKPDDYYEIFPNLKK